MQRNKLIREVKEEYARLAAMQSRDEFASYDGLPGDAYFERLLEQVIHAIEDGRFDRFMNGRQVMEAVANAPDHWGIPRSSGMT